MEDCMEMNEAMLSSPAWQFRMLHVAHRSALDSLLERHGLKDYGHPFILFLLMRSGEDGCMSMQKELSKWLRVSPATVTSAVKLLEKQGCIVREAAEQDLRRKRIRITDKGREVAQRYIEVFTEADEAMYGGFTEAELGAVSDFFERMTANLRALAGQEAEA